MTANCAHDDDPGPYADRLQLGQAVAATLRSDILAGKIAPGEFVRVGALATRLAISGTPVREALVTLQGEGFLELLPNRGFRVRQLSSNDVHDAYQVHRFVAGELAARAAMTASSRCLERLDALQERIEAAYAAGDPQAVDAANDAFHRTLYNAAEAPTLSLFLGLALRYVPRNGAIQGWSDASATDHGDILRALHVGDPDAARMATVAHIGNAEKLLLAHLDRVGAMANAPKDTANDA
jgi:DNA-binding GntR family transcriptional regulator